MKQILLTIFQAFGIHRLFRWLHRNKVLILMYHGFIDKTEFEGISNYHKQNLHVDIFKSHLEYLTKNYNVISLHEYIDSLNKKKTLPQYSLVITIDDGYKSNYIFAFPLLRKYRSPATIFVTTDFVDNNNPLWVDKIENAINKTSIDKFDINIDSLDYSFELSDINSKIECDRKIKSILKNIQQEKRAKIVDELQNTLGINLALDEKTNELYKPLSWKEINEMIQSGLITIGSHSHFHYILAKCSVETMESEIRDSKNIIEENTKRTCDLFCYPNGKRDDYNSSTRDILAKYGFKCSLTTIPGFNDNKTDPFELYRIGTGDERNILEFKMKVSGVLKYLSDIKNKVKMLV